MKEKFITIENETKIRQIKEEDILSVSVDSKIVSFELENGETISKTVTLINILEDFDNFIQITKSSAVNQNKIYEIMKKERVVILTNKKEYHVSRRNMSKIRSGRQNDRLGT